MLSVNQLTGGYARQHPVIKNVSFSVKPGEMVGLIGLNGAGKSTTIKNILGLVTPFSGTVTINGYTLSENPESFRSQLAYIPETPQFYEELTLWEHLELTASAYQLSREEFQQRAGALLERFRMNKVKNWFPDTFSKGMQQKIMILCAFLVRPRFLIIDEPFVGLDPLAIRSLLQLLEERKKEGMGILMSTHILETAEKFCERFVLLHEGEVRFSGTLSEMNRQAGTRNKALDELFMLAIEGKRS
ncbi:ABC transporter ATP-binding protein [Thermoactinomyces intermedius]|jgi:ABC-2 type transport system ATP-binding protein|uniref:ABC transporter ATP-binding protein n=1 Tax=Thermoactinomyces intermedius TaxID=2024 RepID=A0A8I1DBM2_THEIN|nr:MULTISPECIES: ABC transporter ATP-binding protein [Thermoactinomyces]MBA4548660.1 ABC transporter ATP-binding protein [Thermoactinomyces intermedius]MBA4836734.1 ABC transporter ATP-binding protein [Thermoactinomyces intermedius]MBH8594538.1 ABC transporter ATP-binding protein [Thermoactinomyces intermedius]MBH8601558.1 ABC transporter ATP-binding protein [Thermoactinomyces sp. CICC 23799]